MLELGGMIVALVIIYRRDPVLVLVPLFMYLIGNTTLQPFEYARVGFASVFLGWGVAQFWKYLER